MPSPSPPTDLLAYASTVLARYELPTAIHLVDHLPRTESGKVDLLSVHALLDAEPVGR